MRKDIGDLASALSMRAGSARPPEAEPGRDGSCTISIVVPAFNEEENLPTLCERLSAVFGKMQQRYEVILVDDGSSDGTWDCIQALSNLRQEVHGIRLSRNFGHQAAVLAGIDDANGDAVITMDADLQHPPELIPELLSRWRDGADVVNTTRTYPQGTSFIKRASSVAFEKLIGLLCDKKLVPYSSDFRVLDRDAVRALRTLRERTCFLRGLMRWIGYSQAEVAFEADERFAGETKYSLRKLIALALTGITSLSTTPLRLPAYFGAALLVLALVVGVGAALAPVWGIAAGASFWIIWSVLVGTGLQMVGLGIIGEYTARIYEETRARPQYLVRDTCGQSAQSSYLGTRRGVMPVEVPR